MTVTPHFHASRAAFDMAFEKYLWTAPALNGAGLLALANIVANAADQQAAIVTFTVPLILVAAGIAWGGAAVAHGLHLTSIRTAQGVAQDKADFEQNRLRGFKSALTEMPMSRELAALIHGPGGDDEIRRLYRDVAAQAIKAESESAATFDLAMQELDGHALEAHSVTRRARRAHVLSTALVALAVCWAIGQAWYPALQRAILSWFSG